MMDCNELVELITDYLEGTLDTANRRRFEEHLKICDGCTAYLEQMRGTLKALGRVPSESIGQASRDRLLQAFRNWKDAR